MVMAFMGLWVRKAHDWKYGSIELTSFNLNVQQLHTEHALCNQCFWTEHEYFSIHFFFLSHGHSLQPSWSWLHRLRFQFEIRVKDKASADHDKGYCSKDYPYRQCQQDVDKGLFGSFHYILEYHPNPVLLWPEHACRGWMKGLQLDIDSNKTVSASLDNQERSIAIVFTG